MPLEVPSASRLGKIGDSAHLRPAQPDHRSEKAYSHDQRGVERDAACSLDGIVNRFGPVGEAGVYRGSDDEWLPHSPPVRQLGLSLHPRQDTRRCCIDEAVELVGTATSVGEPAQDEIRSVLSAPAAKALDVIGPSEGQRFVLVLPGRRSHHFGPDPARLQPGRNLAMNELRSTPKGIVPRMLGEPGLDRIRVDVADQGPTVVERSNTLREEAATDQGSVAAVAAVEPAGVPLAHALHSGGEPARETSDKRMVVRRHHGVGMDLDLATTDLSREARQEVSNVTPVLAHRSPRNPAIRDVVPRTGLVFSTPSWHPLSSVSVEEDEWSAGWLQPLGAEPTGKVAESVAMG